MSNWHYMVMIILLVLLVWLLWKEVRRPLKARLPWRMLATMLALVALGGLTWPVVSEQLSETSRLQITKTPAMPHVEACYWPQETTAGNTWTVEGRFDNRHGKPITLYLDAFGEHLDSLELPAGEQRPFTLKGVPKHTGRAVYTILGIAAGDTIVQEPLPVNIQSPLPLTILLLSGAPDPEHRFLADWLGENGYKAVIRNKVSRDKYAFRYINLSPVSLETLTGSNLQPFDIVISNAGACSAAERNLLALQLEKGKTGWIVREDSAGPHPRALRLKTEQTADSWPSLLLDAAAALRMHPDELPLMKDSLGRVYAATTLKGQGMLLRTQVHNTYTWRLQGYTNDYDKLWTQLLQTVAPAKTPAATVRFLTDKAMADHPLHIQLLTVVPVPQQPAAAPSPTQVTTTPVPQLLLNGDPLPLQQLPDRPAIWNTTCWPRKSGWQAFTTADGVCWKYIFRHEDWKSMTDKTIPITTRKGPPVSAAAIPPGYWAILLLACCFFLWIERKL